MAGSPAHIDIAPGPDESIAVDPGVDSAIEDDDADSLCSVPSEVFRYTQGNGRTYHGFRRGTVEYPLPNDEKEKDRLDLTHHLWQVTFSGDLTLNPGASPARVLDLGTGTGIWAIEYADANPQSEVVGVDISPIQPQFVPPNCRFEIDDIEQEWTYTGNFNFIFCRSMIASIKDWERLARQAYENLEEGGYFEIQDHEYPLYGNEGDFETTNLSRWSHLIVEAANKLGQPADMAPRFKGILEKAGFTDIRVQTQYVPIGNWARDPKLKEIGLVAGAMFYGDVEGISLALFTQSLGWAKEQVETMSAAVRNDLRNNRIHSYSKAYAVWGRKPARGAAS